MGLAPLALQHAQGGADQPADPGHSRFDSAGGAGDPLRAVVELGKAALGRAQLGVLADQEIAQAEDFLLLAGKLPPQLGITLPADARGSVDVACSDIRPAV